MANDKAAEQQARREEQAAKREADKAQREADKAAQEQGDHVDNTLPGDMHQAEPQP